MREILFRGKRLDNGKWCYGSYLFLRIPKEDWTGQPIGNAEEVHYVIDEKDMNYAIKPETVEQYTGLDDRDGIKIFEGDIVRFNRPKGEWGNIAEIIFESAEFRFRPITNAKRVWNCRLCGEESDLSVIGNIHDNPELLEK